MNSHGPDATRYDERFTLPIPGGLDHIEALAILVTEIAHFERSARAALKVGIVEDAVPEDTAPATL
jgi:hypothetical protein